MIEIAPSIISADFSRLAQEIQNIEAVVNFLHIDVMDGYFVPNLTIGPPVIRSLRQISELQFDVHLMIREPYRYIDACIASGADLITFHMEALDQSSIKKSIDQIHDGGKKAGLALKPNTPISALLDFLEEIDLILCMTVNPGFSGQNFMPETLPKIVEASEAIESLGLPVILEVDGGITKETAPLVVNAGANLLVVGSAIFGHSNPVLEIKKILRSVK